MAFTTPIDWTTLTGQTITATHLNQQIRNNILALWPGTTAGDIDFYDSATTKARVGIGSSGQFLSVVAGVPAWATIPTPTLIAARQGGSSTVWSTNGTSNYTPPSTSKIECGVIRIAISSAASGNATITFPAAFTYAPLVVLGSNMISGGLQNGSCFLYYNNLTNTGVQINVLCASTTVTLDVNWMAIGV
jgi:hypothetical protein